MPEARTATKTLLFSRDPGAANQMLALYEVVCGTRTLERVQGKSALHEFVSGLPSRKAGDVIVCVKDFAGPVWRAAGVEPVDWHQVVPEQADRARNCDLIAAMLRDRNVSQVVTGVGDFDDGTNQDIWTGARHAGVPSAACMDNDEVEFRFEGARGNLVFPDRIFAVDEASRSKILALGAREVSVVGNLHLARLQELANANTVGGEAGRMAAVRREWGAPEGHLVVLFASEAWDEMKELGRPTPESEFGYLDALIQQIEAGRRFGTVAVDPARCLIVVRPHPRDRQGKYDGYVNGSRTVRLIVSRGSSSADAILAADVVAGMTSMLLKEAELLGKPVVRLTRDEI
jgi:hypothetical protein